MLTKKAFWEKVTSEGAYERRYTARVELVEVLRLRATRPFNTMGHGVVVLGRCGWYWGGIAKRSGYSRSKSLIRGQCAGSEAGGWA